ncbi:MAG: serine/threonine-protein phosphatase [Actinomycetia bacterium]|nr:serine/threonine-protein phosphatase [Actinomycetes bacterium]MCP4225523.1 serine/threonine-protein phosphatase [Actinomycetes bacterium]MCP5035784.1 serine/threonine-protein phosphatase [Actinomycetes bacterium]
MTDAPFSKSWLLGDLQLIWSASSIVGKVRQLNEDSWLDEPGLFIVADGMGGHEAGEVASRITIDVWREHLGDLPLDIQQVEQLAIEANSRVRAYGRAEGSSGMGTTLVGLVLIDNGGHNALSIVNVGDSRCYAFDPEIGLTLVTRDHSVVQELVEAGALTLSEAAVHPDRNLITRAIGVDDSVVPDLVVIPRSQTEMHTQRFLLCSDGVSGELTDETMAYYLAANPDPAVAVQALLDGVMETDAADNATAIVVDTTWVSEPA